MDAISGVGKLMEGFAITLDTVIGHAFEDWGTAGAPSSSRATRPVRRPPGTAPVGGIGASSSAPAAERQAVPQPAMHAVASASGQDDWQDFSAPGGDSSSRTRQAAGGKENAGGQVAAAAGAGAAKPRPPSAGTRQQQQQQPHITSFMSKLDAASEQKVVEWRKRAQQLASELQRVRAQQEEYQRLRCARMAGQGTALGSSLEGISCVARRTPACVVPSHQPCIPAPPCRLQYDKLQGELQQASSQASKLEQENSQLKTRSLPPGADPSLADPLAAQQVTAQMESLLVEKSKLAQENDRLLRENTGLQVSGRQCGNIIRRVERKGLARSWVHKGWSALEGGVHPLIALCIACNVSAGAAGVLPGTPVPAGGGWGAVWVR
jgi:hypothetical protein